MKKIYIGNYTTQCEYKTSLSQRNAQKKYYHDHHDAICARRKELRLLKKQKNQTTTSEQPVQQMLQLPPPPLPPTHIPASKTSIAEQHHEQLIGWLKKYYNEAKTADDLRSMLYFKRIIETAERQHTGIFSFWKDTI